MTYIIPKKQQIKNEMMDRPVVKQEVLEWLRTKQSKISPQLTEIENYANENRVPTIPFETAKFLDFYLGQIKPNEILEIGCAIGYSALLMAENLSENGHLTTIDRFDTMINSAKENFNKSNLSDKITLLEGDAQDILPTLEDSKYDVIFMDCAKSKYLAFLPDCLRILKNGGTLIVDDILQGGTILATEDKIPHRVKNIHRKLNEFLETVMNHPKLKSTVLPLGDGLILIEKLEDNIEL